MFNNAQTRNREEARHDVTRCVLHREGPGGTRRRSFWTSEGSPGPGEDAHTCDLPSPTMCPGTAVLISRGQGSGATALWVESEDRHSGAEEDASLARSRRSLSAPLSAHYPADLC